MTTIDYTIVHVRWLVAQTSTKDVSDMLPWLMVLLVAVVIGLFAVTRVKRWLKREEEPTVRSGFTLGDLRLMRQRGEITAEEFDRTKAQVIAAAQRAAARPSTTPPIPGTFEVLEPKPRQGHARPTDEDASAE